jgi:hypothetical protein
MNTVYDTVQQTAYEISSLLSIDLETVLSQMIEVLQLLLLNELEVIVWKIYLDRFWNFNIQFSARYFLLTGFAAKSYFEDEIHVFQMYIARKKLPSFNRLY